MDIDNNIERDDLLKHNLSLNNIKTSVYLMKHFNSMGPFNNILRE